jgi:hypothetical protein
MDLSYDKPARFRSPRYNKLKKHALEVFERHGGWLSPPAWSVLAGFYPVRAAYSYLLRLHRFGLLERRSSSGSILIFARQRRGRCYRPPHRSRQRPRQERPRYVAFGSAPPRSAKAAGCARAHGDAAALRGERFRRGTSNPLTRGCDQRDSIFQSKIHEAGTINGT